MKNRLALLSIAVVATGLFVLPQTVSMFAGQHSWYDPKDDGIPCEKCHFLEAQEMSALVGPHTGKNTGQEKMGCTFCHRAFVIRSSDPNFTSYLNNSSKVHSGQTLPCLYCHSGDKSGRVPTHSSAFDCWSCHQGDSKPPHEGKYTDKEDCLRCHGHEEGGNVYVYYVPPAKGFGLTQNATDKAYNGNRSAHTKFVLDARNNMTMLEDANEACLGCHSRTGVNITWTRNQYVSYRVTCDKNGYNVSWNGTDDLGTNRTVFNSSSGWNW